MESESPRLLELQRSEEQLRLLIENMGDTVSRHLPDTTITYASPSCRTLLGFDQDEMVGVRAVELVHPDDLDATRALIGKAIAMHDSEYRVEHRLRRRDGSYAWAETVGRLIYAEDGNLCEIQCCIRDVSPRRKAEADLRRLQNLLANIIDSMPSILVGVDADGIVTQWNSGAAKATGIAAADAAGRPLVTVFPRLEEQMQHVREAMRTGKVRSQLRQPREDGDTTYYEDVTVYPLVANGVEEGAVIRVDDVTERVHINEALVQSEKMLSVGGLAAGMAHEVNNPLAGMMQNAYVMNDRLTNSRLPANLRAAEEAGTTMEAIEAFMTSRGILKKIDNIRVCGQQAADVVNNVLSFARQGDGHVAQYSLPELMDQCIDLASNDFDLKKKYDFRHIEIVREYEDDLPDVCCEPGQIKQVILNVLRNGAEAMQAENGDGSEAVEGRSTLSPRLVIRLAREAAGREVRIEIRDNGVGMDEDTRRRVFEPFFTTKPPDRGTGLGLSVSYFIITEKHGGEMEVASAPGKGATFIIRLPVGGAKGE